MNPRMTGQDKDPHTEADTDTSVGNEPAIGVDIRLDSEPDVDTKAGNSTPPPPDSEHPRHPNPRTAQATLAALALVTAAHLSALAFGWTIAATATKPLLMPLLAAYVVIAARPRRPVLLIAAVLCGWVGDVFLMVDAEVAFLAGMGAFAAGHICYQVLFVRGNGRPTRKVAIAAVPYAVVWGLVLAALWPGLDPGLRAPVAVYSLLLATTAVLAVGVNTRAAIGAALFLVSDTLIATGITDLPRPPGVDVWIMSTYVVAQYLLVTGVLAARTETSQRRSIRHTGHTMREPLSPG